MRPLSHTEKILRTTDQVFAALSFGTLIAGGLQSGTTLFGESRRFAALTQIAKSPVSKLLIPLGLVATAYQIFRSAGRLATGTSERKAADSLMIAGAVCTGLTAFGRLHWAVGTVIDGFDLLLTGLEYREGQVSGQAVLLQIGLTLLFGFNSTRKGLPPPRKIGAILDEGIPTDSPLRQIAETHAEMNQRPLRDLDFRESLPMIREMASDVSGRLRKAQLDLLSDNKPDIQSMADSVTLWSLLKEIDAIDSSLVGRLIIDNEMEKAFHRITLAVGDERKKRRAQIRILPPTLEPSPFPYQRSSSNGATVYLIPKPNQRVAVLGDVAGSRTAELAELGHTAIHIDRDHQFLSMSRSAVRRRFLNNGNGEAEARIQYVEDDWFNAARDPSYRANYVEAYFPLNITDVPQRGHSGREPDLVRFVEMTAAKLAPGPDGKAVFIISEQEEIMQDMVRLIREEPSLRRRFEILEEYHGAVSEHPIVGGHGTLYTPGQVVSWIVFRPRYQNS